MKVYKLGIDPYLPSEQYIKSMINAYEGLGCQVFPLKASNIFKINFILLNWFENISGGNYFSDVIQFLKKIIKIIFYLIFQKKIIWTLHNKRPHRNGSRTNFSFCLSKIIMGLLLLTSYKIIIHSKHTLNYYKTKYVKKFVYVPHPNCIDYYGKNIEQNDLIDTKLKLLFFGTIIEYKNLDILIEAIGELNYPDIELSIVGNITSDYKSIIEAKINTCKNISALYRYIPDDEIPGIITNCHLLVVPFDIESCFNASSIILAFSYKRSVLCSAIGTVIDIDNRGLFFSYEYSSPLEHKQKLKEAISNIRNKYCNNYNQILELGNRCFEFVKENNNSNNVLQSLIPLFNNE